MRIDKTILINGVWEVGAETSLPAIDPATEAEIAVVPSAGDDQVSRAIEAAASDGKHGVLKYTQIRSVYPSYA